MKMTNERVNTMQHSREMKGLNYIVAGSIGAMIGGLVVLVASNLIPRMISRMMSEMMKNMMQGRGEMNCSPAEL